MGIKNLLHKIEMENGQILGVKLHKEVVFFANTVMPGTKLAKIIDTQG